MFIYDNPLQNPRIEELGHWKTLCWEELYSINMVTFGGNTIMGTFSAQRYV
jgi:hypothetical protein